jgi:hypothetical protein
VTLDLANVDALFQRSTDARDKARSEEHRRARFKRFAMIGAAVLVALSVGGTLLGQHILLQREQKRLALEKSAADDEERRRVAYQRELLQLQSQLEQATDRLQQSATQAGSTGVTAPNVEQRTEIVSQPTGTPGTALPAPTASPSNPDAACTGAMWIGSDGAGNLRAAAGDGVAAVAAIKRNATYVATTNVRLRRGVPTKDYVQGESIGIVPKGAQVAAMGEPVAYKRPNGTTQYWLDVSVASQICSLIYFQFAGGTPDNARAVADGLQALGYLVPGQELLRTASGLAEVRYYYDEDKGRAEQLTRDAQSVVSKLQLAAGRQIKRVDMTDWPPQKKPPIGTLELWLDLAPAAK